MHSLNPNGTGTSQEYPDHALALVGAAFTGVPPTATEPADPQDRSR
ncbi:hypothetical protein [Streptomyces hydrogenans]